MKHIILLAAAAALFTAACGGGNDHKSMNMEDSTGTTGGGAAGASKTVDITMIDIAYDPKTVNVQPGERLEFVFHNQGKIAHDAFIGDRAAQGEHEKEMTQGSGSTMGHMTGEANAITVKPGKTERLTYTFDKTGTIEIGCHQPGHYAAGMKVSVTVA
jgi:uncharacterized cupredoxin-like copper-binding protein